ncbi:MAG: sensor domain-containing diguanylate cyclase [Nitrospiraceae bacterium]|nr:sensor domain-containing diguanylate cyclase [Nitrospiraceae bacterium]
MVVLIVAVLALVSDAAMDAFLFGNGAFWDHLLFRESRQEVASELFVISLYSAIALLLLWSRDKQRAASRELQQHLTAIETSMDGIALFNREHEYQYVNRAYASIIGFDDTWDMVGRNFRTIYDAGQIAWMEKNIFPVLETKGSWHGELTAHRRNGSPFTQEVSITRLSDGQCVCVMRDISERKRRDDSLRRSEQFLNTIFDSIHDPFCIFDTAFRIVRANEAYADLKEKAIGDLIDRTCYEVLEGRDDVCEGCVIRKTLSSGDPCAKEKMVALKSGEHLWLEIFTYPIRDEIGKVTHVIEYSRDITDRKKSEGDRKRLIERLEHLSSTDGLTGLLNRRALIEQLGYEIERARRYGSPLSIILCDMDNLKEINDTHGHLAGDLAIQLVSATLRNTLRNVDIAGRYGGDEFLIVIPETNLEGTHNIAEKIRTATNATETNFEGKQLRVSVSMGIASLAPGDDIDTFVTRVDVALYSSKHDGRNRITVVHADMLT